MIRIGMVGVGNISGIYLQNITGLFRDIELTAVCDLVREKADPVRLVFRFLTAC